MLGGSIRRFYGACKSIRAIVDRDRSSRRNRNPRTKAMLATSQSTRLSPAIQPRCRSFTARKYRTARVSAAQASVTGSTGGGAGERASRRAALAALVAGVAAIPQQARADDSAQRQGEVRCDARNWMPVVAGAGVSSA